MTKTFYSRDDIYLLNRLKSYNGQQHIQQIPPAVNKTTDCLTLESSDILLVNYNCNDDESNECIFSSNTSGSSISGTHQRASSMYSCHSDTTTVTTNTTSSGSEIDLTGLIEGLVDDECGLDDINDEKDRGDDDCYISAHTYPAPSNQLVALREVLEKDPIERTEPETEIILNFINSIAAFSKYDVNVRKQLASVMVLAIIEKANTIILTHLEILDSFCCLVYGQVEHLVNNKTSRQLYPGDIFGITEPTTDTIYFEGIMKTCTPYCWFLCVSQTDFYKIINHQSEYCKYEEDGAVVLITEQKSIDSYHKGHVVIRGTPSRLLLGLLECDATDPFYIDDFLLTYRIFMPPAKGSSVSPLLSGMETICAKLLSWFDEQHLRDKVIRIVLTWLNSYYLDFDNSNLPNAMNPSGQQFLQLFETKLCASLTLTTQLRLFHIALSTKAKIRQMTITRSNRDEVLNFSILGGYERGFGIFVSKVEEDSKAEQIGLRRGDQILEVNGCNFTIISHARALEVLRSTTHLALTVKYNPFMFREMITLPEGSKAKKTIAASLHPSAAMSPTLNSTALRPKTNGGVLAGGTKIKKAIPKFANFISRHFNTVNEDEVDFQQSQPKNLLSSRSHSNPDLHSLSSSVSTSLYDLISGHANHFTPHPQHVLRVFNAANGDSRYLLVHAETTAREVVMVSVREFGLCTQSSSGVKSSLNYALYEVSVVPEANTIKQKRLPDQLNNLADRASLHSRYYIKENTTTTASSSATQPTQQQHLSDDIAAEILRECPQPVTFLSLNATQVAIELTLQDFNTFRLIEPQEFIYDLFADELKKNEKELDMWRKELQEFEALSNKEMFWVINEILNENSLIKRVKIIKYFIKIGNICRSLHNYNSLFAILSGLGHGSVQRLKQTWDKLGAKYQKILKALQKIMDPSRNMALYRGEINTCSPPIIPFFPMVKKDLTFIHLAHNTAHHEDGLINFEKMRMIGREVRAIINMSSQQYCSTPSSFVSNGALPLPPPPPTTTVGPSATTPKRMFEEAMMRKKVKHYLNAVFSAIVYDEDALLAKSLEIEGGSLPGPAQSTPATKQAKSIACTQPSPTLSSASSGSSSGKLKFGAESPQQLRKLLSLSEVDSKTLKNSHHPNSHPHNLTLKHVNLNHMRSVSDGQSHPNIMFNTVSFQSQPHLPNHAHNHIPFPPYSSRHSSVPLPVESSSVTSLRRLEQLQQLKKYQCTEPPFPNSAVIRPPLPNYDEAVQRQHKLANLVSSTKPVSRTSVQGRQGQLLTLAGKNVKDDDKVSAV